MDYQKVIISIEPFQEWLCDVLNSQLAEIGFNSFVEIENGIEAYIPAPECNPNALEEVLLPYKEDFDFIVETEFIKDQNWNEEWEKNYFKPLVIKNECVVRAPFHSEYPKAKYEIIIEPNMAFGTGNHETTEMMLEYVLEEELKGKIVLDMGCGTGILGILASMKGTEKVTAIDIDEWSFKGTKDNSVLNNIGNIKVKHGDVSLLGDEKYDYIFANIQKNVLIADLPVYTKCLKENGKIFLSGFYENDIQDIKSTAEKQELTDAGYKIKNNWVAHVFKKGE
jgi:ribosomal protein L11 methyltransferase